MREKKLMFGVRLALLLLLLLLPAAAVASAPVPPGVWYGPSYHELDGATRTDLFPLLTTPSTSWPKLAKQSSTFKLFLDVLFVPDTPGLPAGHGSTDDELSGLIKTLKQLGMKVGIEVGGARWGAGHCTKEETLAYAAVEQAHVARWIKLGGNIDSMTTDHACVWNIRGKNNPNPTPKKKSPNCVPAVSMPTRIDLVAQVFASWRTFFKSEGQRTSLGFIESLG